MANKFMLAVLFIVAASLAYIIWKQKSQAGIPDKTVSIPTTPEEFNRLWDDAGSRLKPLIMLGEARLRQLNPADEKQIRYSIQELEACLSFKSDHWGSMLFLAKAHQALGEDNEAFSFLKKAIEIEKNNHLIFKEASLQAVKLGDMGKAIEYSKEALRIKPSDPELLGNYAMNLLITSKDNEAKMIIEKALEIEPNDQFNKKISRLISDVILGKRKRPVSGKWEQ